MKIVLSGIYGTKPLEFVYEEYKLIDLFHIANELKFDGVDYISTLFDVFFTPSLPLRLSKKYKVPILSVHTPMHILFYTPTFFFKKLATMYKYFPECKVLNFHLSGFIHPLNIMAGDLDSFLKLAKKYNAPLSIESNPLLSGLQYYPKITYDPEDFADFCIKKKLPITFDTAHVAHCNYDIVDFFKKYRSHIKLIHLSDSIGKNQHLPLGEGNLPIKDLLKEIKKHSYKETIAFEICHFPKGATLEEKISKLKQSLDMVRKYAR